MNTTEFKCESDGFRQFFHKSEIRWTKGLFMPDADANFILVKSVLLRNEFKNYQK